MGDAWRWCDSMRKLKRTSDRIDAHTHTLRHIVAACIDMRRSRLVDAQCQRLADAVRDATRSVVGCATSLSADTCVDGASKSTACASAAADSGCEAALDMGMPIALAHRASVPPLSASTPLASRPTPVAATGGIFKFPTFPQSAAGSSLKAGGARPVATPTAVSSSATANLVRYVPVADIDAKSAASQSSIETSLPPSLARKISTSIASSWGSVAMSALPVASSSASNTAGIVAIAPRGVVSGETGCNPSAEAAGSPIADSVHVAAQGSGSVGAASVLYALVSDYSAIEADAFGCTNVNASSDSSSTAAHSSTFQHRGVSESASIPLPTSERIIVASSETELFRSLSDDYGAVDADAFSGVPVPRLAEPPQPVASHDTIRARAETNAGDKAPVYTVAEAASPAAQSAVTAANPALAKWALTDPFVAPFSPFAASSPASLPNRSVPSSPPQPPSQPSPAFEVRRANSNSNDARDGEANYADLERQPEFRPELTRATAEALLAAAEPLTYVLRRGSQPFEQIDGAINPDLFVLSYRKDGIMKHRKLFRRAGVGVANFCGEREPENRTANPWLQPGAEVKPPRAFVSVQAFLRSEYPGDGPFRPYRPRT
jgi:hypothetical protein